MSHGLLTRTDRRVASKILAVIRGYERAAPSPRKIAFQLWKKFAERDAIGQEWTGIRYIPAIYARFPFPLAAREILLD